MGKVIRPEPGVERVADLGVCHALMDPANTLCPYSYGTPCYWVWHGAFKATVALRPAE